MASVSHFLFLWIHQTKDQKLRQVCDTTAATCCCQYDWNSRWIDVYLYVFVFLWKVSDAQNAVSVSSLSLKKGQYQKNIKRFYLKSWSRKTQAPWASTVNVSICSFSTRIYLACAFDYVWSEYRGNIFQGGKLFLSSESGDMQTALCAPLKSLLFWCLSTHTSLEYYGMAHSHR